MEPTVKFTMSELEMLIDLLQTEQECSTKVSRNPDLTPLAKTWFDGYGLTISAILSKVKRAKETVIRNGPGTVGGYARGTNQSSGRTLQSGW